VQSLDKKYKVCIGSRQMCSCADGELCVHLLFVMLRVLGVPQANAVLWQHSLTDNEVAAVLAKKLGGADGEQAKHRYLRRGSAGDAAGAAAPRTLTEDSMCPICMDEMQADGEEAQEPVTHCKKSCGNHVHVKCMIMYAEHALAENRRGKVRSGS